MNRKKRKKDHIKLSGRSQVIPSKRDNRFNYEPLFANPVEPKYTFLGEEIGGPIFLSSITGGVKSSKNINRSIYSASTNLNLPMGLGSIRPLLDNPNDNTFIDNSRNSLIYGNIGIAQLNRWDEINRVIDKFNLKGLIIHINPLQEWCQPEGDRFLTPPIDILSDYLPKLETKIIVKEVGQGFGPRSLEALTKLPIDAIDFAAFGGTNFTKLELLRAPREVRESYMSLSNIGHTNWEMIEVINSLQDKNLDYIVSGGIRDFLDGYYYINKLNRNAIYGYAYKVLKHALKGEKSLINFLEREIEGVNFASSILTIK